MTLKKGAWSPDEDEKLRAYIKRYGIGTWSAMAKAAGLTRSGKSCRLRWVNYLRPDIKRGNFSREEEEAILKMHKILGNKWARIAAALPGRTDNEIKNHWHTHLKKRIHKPKEKPEQNNSPELHDDHPMVPSIKVQKFSSKEELKNVPHFGMEENLNTMEGHLGFAGLPFSAENYLYNTGSPQDMIADAGFTLTLSELWYLEPPSQYGF